MKPYVLDVTATLAVFAGGLDDRAYDLLWQADRGGRPLAIPSTVIAEANCTLQETPNAWEAVLGATGVQVLPLTEQVSIAVPPGFAPLYARHTIYEAGRLGAVIATRVPRWYRPVDIETMEV